MTPKVTLRAALEDAQLLGASLQGPSWASWRAVLMGAMGEPLLPDELDLFRRLTGGRVAPPSVRVEELWGIVGRRGGKSKSIGALAVYLGGLCDWSDKIAPGETGTVFVIAPDQKQARIILQYATSALEASPVLSQLIKNRTADALELTNKIVIEVRAASFRRLRGPTCVAVIADEAAFWHTDESANPDTEILNAVRPTLATTGGPLIVISSPYARKGAVYEAYRKHYGADGDPRILVAQGASRDFNPSLPQSVVDRAMESDPASALAEYGGQFRTDIESYIRIESVRACIVNGIRERAPERAWKYHAFVDPSGGSADAMTLAIGHKEGKDPGTAILDLVREVKPPFSPEATVEDFANTLHAYRITKVVGDRYAGEWPREQFRKHGANYEVCESPRSDLYRDFLPLVNSRCVDLLDNEKLVTQLVSLERRTGRGKDIIDHPPGAHDDIANAVAGVIARVWTSYATGPGSTSYYLPKQVTANLSYSKTKRKTGRYGARA